MQVCKLRVQELVKSDLLEYLFKEISFVYNREFGDTTIIAGEEFRLRNSSTQSYFIALNSTDTYLYIDIVCGGGSGGIINILWDSENSFVKKAKGLIAEFCTTNGKTIEEIDF